MKLIDADALRASFESEIGEHFCEFGGWCTVFRDASSVIDKAPTIDTKPQWIPVTERIPQSDRYVLLSFENFSLPLVGRCETDEEGSAFFIGDETVSCSNMCVFVNAWMELPEPYDPEDIEKEDKA